MPCSCLVSTCKNRGVIPGITYHSIGKQRYVNWIVAIGRNPTEKLSPRNVICSKHFLPDDFIQIGEKTILKKDAVPKLHLPQRPILKGIENISEPPEKRMRISTTSARNIVTVDVLADSQNMLSLPGPSSAPDNQWSTNSDDNGLEKSSGSMKKKMLQSSSDSVGLRGSPKRNRKLIKRIHTYATTTEKVKNQLENQKQKYDALKKRHKLEKRRIKRLRVKVHHLKDIVGTLKRKELLSSDACSVLEKSFSGIPLALMKRMLHNHKIGKLSRQKYSETIRSFALTLHFYSSKAYEYVRKTFNLALPSQRIIRSWFSNIYCDPGFSQPAFESLSDKVKNNKEKGHGTFCSLMLDEMSIKKHIDYCRGKTWGYIDLGTKLNEDDSMEIATEALVLMVVAINGNWKLPIAYFFIHCLKGPEKANIVREALVKLYDCGVIVTSVTCDGPSANFSMMTDLGGKFADVNDIVPYFLHPVDQSKVYIIFDVCHMVKLLRNSWATLEKFIDPDGNVVDFRYIITLHNIQQEEGLRLGNKLRKVHLDWKKQKMKVNLAVQTLSESVATAIEFLHSDLKDSRFRNSSATVKFIRLVDKVFDLLNSRSPITVRYKMPLQEANQDKWLPVFKEAINYFSKCKTIDNVPLINTIRKTTFKGFIITLLSVIGIYEDYVKLEDPHKLKYLLTYKLSQDHLDLFFCSVRSRNGWNNNPSAWQFRNTYKRLLLHHDIKNMSGNCISQDATNVLYISGCTKTEVPMESSDVAVIRKYGLDFQENVIADHDYTLPINISLSEPMT